MPDADNVPIDAHELPVTSSLPTHVPAEQASLFREVLLALEEKQVPYAVSGAFALRHHTGICRFTKDLDLFLTAKTAHEVFPYLRACGFECEVVDPVWLAKARKAEFFVDLITGMSNGVIVVNDPWIERAKPAVIHGVTTRVLAPEELIASKIFVAKRERFAGADIAHVIYGTYRRFDWDRELQLVGEHWEMLLWSLILFRYIYPAQTHYVPASIWQKLLCRFQKEIATPHADAKFRGSLVDDNMFAIDVNEWKLPDLLEQKRQERLAGIGQIGKSVDSGVFPRDSRDDSGKLDRAG